MNGRGKYSKPTPSSIEEIDNESVPFLFLITMTEAIWRESICFTNHNQNSIVVIVMFDSRALASAFLPDSPISLIME